MNAKTEILCNVNSCKFQKDQRCHAKTISVCCDNCVEPNCSHETACQALLSARHAEAAI